MRVVQQHRTLDDAFVQDAVALLQRSDRPAVEAAKSLGISKSTLWRWYNDLVTKRKKPKSTVPTSRRTSRSAIWAAASASRCADNGDGVARRLRAQTPSTRTSGKYLAIRCKSLTSLV
jgi:predicted DNA-binding transcriptional regulator AlpA